MPKRSNEPIFWLLFAGGGTLASLLLPMLVFITGIAVPLGIMPAEALSFERMSAFAGSLIGKLALFAFISLLFWHALHRIYHGMHDLGIHGGTLFQVLAYGAALVGTLVTGYYLLLI